MERRRQHLDSLFEMALVLLGILSAAELQYFLAIESKDLFAYALKVFTVPMLILIVFWLTKELSSDVLRRDFAMLLTEFCWDFWSFTLFYYLLAILGFTIGILLSLTLSILLVISISWAYRRASPVMWGDRSMFNYYRSFRWRILRINIFLGSYLLLVGIVIP